MSTAMLLGQREASNWYFGNNAGLDFNSGVPVVLSDGKLDTLEGCESFSDLNGNLLFYTDGKTVWNKFHQIMSNGENLRGSFSTTQSALVVPNVSDPNIYYIFTPDDVITYSLGFENNSSQTNGLNYSVIDMTQDGGRGSVVEKNIRLLDQAGENVTAVRNFDANDYWVVVHFKDSFYSFRVDGNGVNMTPIVSKIGPELQSFNNYRGAIKIAPNGNRLAIAHTINDPNFKGALYVYDFDVETGRVTNEKLLSQNRMYYGVEFSSNSLKLYASGLELIDEGLRIRTGATEIAQFDLSQNATIETEYLVHRYENVLPGIISGALQIGIDKKIYHSLPGKKLSVIRTPNLAGVNSDFRLNSVDLGAASTSYGLPPFIQSFFETIVTIENFCEGNSTSFTIDNTENIQAVEWNFGDATSGVANLSTVLSPSHVFSDSGPFTVTLKVEYRNGSSREFIEFVEIAEVPSVSNQVELVQCDVDGDDDGLSLFNLNEASHLFNNGNENIKGFFFANLEDAIANENQLNPIGYRNVTNKQVIYARAFEKAECYAIVEIILTVQLLSDLGLYDTLPICSVRETAFFTEVDTNPIYERLFLDFGDDSAKLYATVEHALLEQDEIENGLYIFELGQDLEFYFRIENDNDCEFIGKLKLELVQKPTFEQEVVVTLCNSEAVLIAPVGATSYLWSTGENLAKIKVFSSGEYQVNFTNQTCSFTQNFSVVDTPAIEIEEITVNDFKTNNEIVINTAANEQQNISFSIDGGLNFQESNVFKNLAPGIYKVEITNGCSLLKKTVVVGGLDSFFTPNNDGINDKWIFNNSEFFPNFKMLIFDKFGKLMKMFQKSNNGWDGTHNELNMPSNDYWYKLVLEDESVVTGHFTLKR